MAVSRRDERGQTISLFLLIMAVPLIAIAGLAYDGSRYLAAQREANDVALQAARAGAQAVSDAAFYGGDAVVVDGPLATAAAQRYLSARGYSGSVSVNPEAVTVTVTVSHTPAVLDILPGIGTRSFTGRASATPLRGVDGP
jgi:hypothetical protein